jgi:regulator of sigma E protease
MEKVLAYSFQVFMGLLGLSFLVLIHEMGHLLVAKYFGIRVKAFSIGFGKRLVGWKWGETDYYLSLIPFGGYVAMGGENPEEVKQRGPQKGDFSVQPIRVRAAVAFAGPFVNVVFAFFLLFALGWYGVEEPVTNRLIVGQVQNESPAAEAGVQAGDTIVKINGREIANGWQSFREEEGTSLGAPVELLIKRAEQEIAIEVVPEEYRNMGVGYSGIHPGHKIFAPSAPNDSTSAAKAGIQALDTVLSVNGRLISSGRDMIELIQLDSGKTTNLEIVRGADTLAIALAATWNAERQAWLIGMPLGHASLEKHAVVERSFGESWVYAAEQSWTMAGSIFRYLGKIFKGHVEVKALSGPVGIVPVIGLSFLESPIKMLLLIALISINLGVLNLLPLFITDGGVLLFLLVEAVRGKPLALELQIKIQQTAAMLFIMLFLYITFQDVGRLSWLFP